MTDKDGLVRRVKIGLGEEFTLIEDQKMGKMGQHSGKKALMLAYHQLLYFSWFVDCLELEALIVQSVYSN